MSVIIKVKTLDHLFTEVFRGLVDGDYVDKQIRPSVFSYTNLMVSKSCRYDFDLGKVGLTPTRWPRLINDYVDRNRVVDWLPKIKKLGRGRELLYPFNEVKPVKRKKMSNYNYGACLLGITYRAYPPKVTLFSRATNWSQIGALDLGMAYAFAWHIADYMGNLDVEEIEFVWQNSGLYLMPITCVPWLVSSGRLAEVVEGDFLISRDIRNLLKYYKDIHEPAYSPIKRIRKRTAFILDDVYQRVPVDGFRLFTDREWETFKSGGMNPESPLKKLRGGYTKTKRQPGGPLFQGVTYDLVKEFKKRKNRLVYNNGYGVEHVKDLQRLSRRNQRNKARPVGALS